MKKRHDSKDKIRNEINIILKQMFLIENEIRVKINIDLPEDIFKIKNILKNNGYQLFLVGGSVRDAVLGKEPKDFDLATDALPDTVQNLVLPNYKTLETGKAFGVINVFTPTGDFEIATFRRDLTPGRRPDAVEYTTIDQDASRRDLSINSLYYDIDKKEIIDFNNGLEDLKNGIIRTVGNPEERFSEDALRKLRSIRFAARFGSNLDPSVGAALKNDNSLQGVSSERIRDEFLKGIKSAKSVVHFLRLLERYNLFGWIFGSLVYKERGMQSGDFIEERDPVVLLSFMLQDNPVNQIKSELHRLTYTADEISKIIFLVSLIKLTPDNSYQLKKAEIHSRIGAGQITSFADWNKMNETLVNYFLKFKLTVTGQEMLDRGLKGAEIGQAIEKAEIANFKKL